MIADQTLNAEKIHKTTDMVEDFMVSGTQNHFSKVQLRVEKATNR